MSPLVSQFVKHVDFAEWVQNTTHQTCFANGPFHRIEAAADNSFRTHNTCNGASYFAQNIVSTGDGFLSCCDGVGCLLSCFQPRIQYRHRYHPNTMLHAGRQCRNFWEQPLVCWTSHHLVWISLRTTVWANDYHCRS